MVILGQGVQSDFAGGTFRLPDVHGHADLAVGGRGNPSCVADRET
jgi:hypothetical protein